MEVPEQERKKLDKPTGLNCVEAEEDSLTVAWEPVTHASGYMVLCKDVLAENWEDCENAMTSADETTAKITHLWPTATFEVKVIAISGNTDFLDSDESDVIYCDTAVGSCAPKKKRCLGLC